MKSHIVLIRVMRLTQQIRLQLQEGDGHPGYDSPTIQKVTFERTGRTPIIRFIEVDDGKSTEWVINRAIASVLSRDRVKPTGLAIASFKREYSIKTDDVSDSPAASGMTNNNFIGL